MKTWKIFLLAAIILPLQTFAACLDASRGDDVDGYLAQKLAAKGFAADAIPAMFPLSFKLHLEGQIPTSSTPLRKGKKQKTVFEKSFTAEAFIKMEPGAYRLIPGIGLNLKTSDDSLFYVCIEKKGQRPSNFVRIIHLDRQGIRTKRFKVDVLPANFNPLDEGTIGTLILGDFLQSINLNAPSRFIDKLNKVFQTFIFRTGVEQIEIRPKEVELLATAKIFNSIKTPDNSLVVPFKSSWLTDP